MSHLPVPLPLNEYKVVLVWDRFTLLTLRIIRPYWRTIYALEAFLLMQVMYDILKVAIAEYGYDDRFLNALWLALLGLETFLVLGLAARYVAQRLKEPEKLKTT